MVDFIDKAGSGAFEAFAGRLETNLASAPCGQYPRGDCPGSLGGCLLEVDHGVLQDQLDFAGMEMSAFVLAAMEAGFSYDEALRKEVEMELEMKRLAGEMDSIH